MYRYFSNRFLLRVNTHFFPIADLPSRALSFVPARKRREKRTERKKKDRWEISTLHHAVRSLFTLHTPYKRRIPLLAKGNKSAWHSLLASAVHFHRDRAEGSVPTIMYLLTTGQYSTTWLHSLPHDDLT